MAILYGKNLNYTNPPPKLKDPFNLTWKDLPPILLHFLINLSQNGPQEKEYL
jgi:hypothetical protein